jgi:polar amino acid transport system substrate-binding protein
MSAEEKQSNRGLWIGLGIAVIVALVLVVTLLSQILAPSPSPTATAPIVTTPPPAGEDTSWTDVVSRGRLIVGTSADYPPFEYYTDDFQIDGFDIALMREIGQNLGVPVEFNDFAFDGLAGALSIRQIDAAIAAISVTPERQALFDFSNVYYVGGDGALANADSDIVVNTGADLAQYRVGVQKASIYENWLRINLVDAGLMPAGNLYVYAQAQDAVRDLQAQNVDVVVMDLLPAQEAVTAGGVKLVGQQVNTQLYAVGVRNGASALQTRLNEALTALQNEGRVAALAQEYLDVTPDEIIPPETVPTPTPEPAQPTPAPPACIDASQHVADLSFDDQNMTNPPLLNPGQSFIKSWRVQNVGTCTWNTGYRLAYVGGNSPQAQMGGQPVAVAQPVAPGATYDFSVSLVAPVQPGTYQGFWQTFNDRGVAFGERVWVGISVPGAPTPTPAPTQTPAPGISFTVDRTNIRQGECVTFSWNVVNVRAVYFYAEGQNWQDHGVAGQGSSVQCPQQTTTYYLRVVNPDNSVTLQQITISVQPVVGAPVITQFAVNPPQITLGQCVTIQWQVEGSVTRVTISVQGAAVWDGAPLRGSLQNCPPGAGSVEYALQATGPGGNSQARKYVNVVLAATATPVPTPAPEQPAIDAFSVNPTQIQVGQCVNISWGTSGGTVRVQVKRDSDVILDNAPFAGSVQDCPQSAGTPTYSVVAFNSAGQSVNRQQAVNVTEAPPENPLAGTSWLLIQYNNGQGAVASVLTGTTLTAQFGASGQLNGSAGCNTYSASYIADATTLSVGSVIASQQFCAEPAGIMDQESAYLAALPKASTYVIQGQQLTVRDASGQTLLVYQPLLAEPR